MKKYIDWEATKLEFITDSEKPSLRQFCGKHNLPYSTASTHSSDEKWMQERQTYWAKIEKVAEPLLKDVQVVVFARDITQKLYEIGKMKQAAYDQAGGGDNLIVYEKPSEAVAAYERLEKLERLILGESTENIKVEDARAMVESIIDAVLEEVRDDADRSRLLDRLESIGSKGTNRAGSLN